MNEKKFQRNVRIAISPVCNMKCIYCEGNNGFGKNGRTAAMEDIRRKPISEGNITTEELLEILKVFYKVGFNGITLTGGEPTVNKEWDKIINETAKIGFERREMTTNGVLLGDYFRKHGKLPKLTLIKISFDTDDKEEFNRMTGGDFFDKVVDSVKTVSPHINIIRANKVMLRKDLKDLNRYINFCRSIGFTAVNLLELVAYPNSTWTEENKNFFKEQFVPYEEMIKELRKVENLESKRYKYGHISIAKDGFQIMATDSKYTIRDEQCKNCPIDCQQGKFTVRIATDGNITMCPDYKSELVSINGIEALKNNTLETRLREMFETLTTVPEIDWFDEFRKKYDLL